MQAPEIETKILEINKTEVVEKLQALGAELLFEGVMRATYFDFEDESLQKSNRLLRLRMEGDNKVLVFKKVSREEGIRDNVETSVNISDFDGVATIFKELGLKENFFQEKFRTEYKIGGLKVAIDTYKGRLAHIPTFLEIEGHNASEVKEFAIKLGFSPEHFVNWSTKELVEHYSG